MSISIFKKAVALVCGAATMLSVGAALSASASGPMVFTADQIYAEPGQIVDYSVRLSNNQGYAASGLSLFFDERLEIQNTSGRSIKPVDAGPAAAGLSTTLGYHDTKHQIGWSTMGNGDDCTADGILYTLKIKVPADAKPGDTFVMDLGEISQLVNSAKETREWQLVDGWIKIAPVTTTTEDSTTTTTTSSSSEEPKTNTTASVSSGDESQTTSESVSGDSSDTESTEATSGSDATDATSNNNGGSDVPGPKTGETGAALAIAGLMTAAGAAYVIRRKH